MPVDLLNPCYCPVESKMQLLFRLNKNLVSLFTTMADNFEGIEINPNSCGCTEVQVLSAINQNIVNFGQVYTGGGGSGSGLATKVTMPTDTSDPGADGEYAVNATQFAYYVTGTGWVFVDGYQL